MANINEDNEKKEQAANEFNTNEKKQPINPMDVYNGLATVQPVKDVKMPDDNPAGAPKTLSEQFDEATDLTDMQFAAARLFPKKTNTNDVQIGRIFPDAFLPLISIAVSEDLMMCDPMAAIDIDKIIITKYVDFGIGLDGQGRIDLAELLGAAKEARRQENMLKNIGS